jgi:spore coat protein CotH
VASFVFLNPIKTYISAVTIKPKSSIIFMNPAIKYSFLKASSWGLIILFFLGCQEKIDPVIPVGDDGQIFAIDTEESSIPYIVIDTQELAIPYEPKVPAQMKIYKNKKLSQTQRIAIEFRGKTSFRLSDKKGFNIETIDASGEGMDVSFFDMPEEEDWRLIGHVVNKSENYIWDRSLMYNFLGYELSRKIGKYASRGNFVEIEVNGEYLGVYFFCEKLKRDSERIAIKSLNATSSNLTGGYILTIDKVSIGDEGIGKPLSYFYNNWDDDARYTAQNSFRSNYDIYKNEITFPAFEPPYHQNQYLETYFQYEYPKAGNITEEQKVYISDYINKFETALITDDFEANQRSYTNYIDTGSFIDYFIINELCRNVDAYRLSTYLVKDRDSKLAMGPVWDMNIGFDEADRIPMNDWVINYNNYVSQDAWMMPFWWPRLMEDKEFKRELKQRWLSLRSGPLSNSKLMQLIEETANLLVENGAVARNYSKWKIDDDKNYDQIISDLKSYMQQRADWMDSEIGAF